MLRAQQMAGANLNLTDSYFFMRRQQATAHLISMGMPQDYVETFLSTKSIPYENFNTMYYKA